MEERYEAVYKVEDFREMEERQAPPLVAEHTIRFSPPTDVSALSFALGYLSDLERIHKGCPVKMTSLEPA